MIQRYTPSVYRFCARMLRDDEDARDAAQNTLVKVIRNLHRYDPERKFSTWVFGIARNTAIDEQRRRRFTTELGDRDLADTRSSPLEETSRQERAERLHEALGQLPPMYREVLVLYHFEHFKYQEIAETLELPLGTVMNRIFRARRRLRELYEAAELPEAPGVHGVIAGAGG